MNNGITRNKVMKNVWSEKKNPGITQLGYIKSHSKLEMSKKLGTIKSRETKSWRRFEASKESSNQIIGKDEVAEQARSQQKISRAG